VKEAHRSRTRLSSLAPPAATAGGCDTKAAKHRGDGGKLKSIDLSN